MISQAFEVDFVNEKIVSATEGQSILEASLEAGIPHYHACGGNGKCSTCRIQVLEGADHLNRRTEKEAFLLSRLRQKENVRLACQAFPTGGRIQVRRIIKDDSDLAIYLGNHADDPGKEMELVLMFLDIKNFTPFARENPAFDVVHILKKMFMIFQHRINQQEGQIIDTAGDGLYAVFGFDGNLPDAAFSAVESSRKIINDTRKFNSQYLKVYFNRSLEIGIGLHSGKVIVGNLVINNTARTTVMGYPVNVASRIQAATRSLNNNLLISDCVANLMPACPAKNSLKVFCGKGIPKEIKVYEMGEAFE